MTPLAQRQTLRRQFRAARRALSSQQQAAASRALVEQFTALPITPSRVAVYLSNDGEVDLTPLISMLWQRGISTSLPVIHPFSDQHLLFLDYQPNTPMTENRFGIAEPALSCPAIRLLAEHDAILLPLVGFDIHGNRLGMGGGFYDRTLAQTSLLGVNKPVLVGVAHDCQQADTLPAQSWDIPLDIMITPTKVIQPSYDNALK